mgnify:CR=1 FL=1
MNPAKVLGMRISIRTWLNNSSVGFDSWLMTCARLKSMLPLSKENSNAKMAKPSKKSKSR